MLASICSMCASSESNSLDEGVCMQLLLGFPSIIVPLAHDNKVRIPPPPCQKKYLVCLPSLRYLLVLVTVLV